MGEDIAADADLGEMAARISQYDWAATSLGPIATWPVQLKCAVDIMLPSRAQIVMFCGPEFVAVYNDAYAPTIGSKHPMALGRPARAGWSELWDDLEPLLRRVLDTGETISAKDRPFYIERPQPETVYFDISYSPVRGDNGKVLAVLCIVSETTDRVGFEIALRLSEERLRSMIDQTSVGVIQADLEGRLSFVNPGFCDIVGYTEEEVLGLTLQQLTHPDDLAENMTMVRRMGEDGRSFVVEKRYIRKDGTPVWVSNHVSALKDSSGKVREAVAVVVDITARRRALEAERRLAAIISSSEDAIVAIDLDMMITDWNSGAEHVYGFSAQEALGQPVAIIIPEDRVDEERRIIERIKAGERVEPHDTTRRHKAGRDVDVSLSVSPIYDAHGRIVGASKIARDISARKEAERVQTVLIGELNHRVKNVLATVIAIARQTFGRAENVELASAVFEARLQSLARAHDLLTHGRWEHASLDRVVEEALSPYPKERFDILGPGIDISPKAVVAMSLVLHELATNAAKYGALSSASGRVHVSWTVSEDETPRLSLSWLETGGPPVAVPSRKGFGTRLIEGMISGQLNGHASLDYSPTGLRCDIEAPLDAAWTADESRV
jgi:PAS domain S-box-containing protein